MLLPVLLFHHARALLLSIDSAVNRGQPSNGHSAPEALAGDDAQAGCALGIAIALILLFGLGMAAVTVYVAGLATPTDG
ncbi:MAG: hypothetical protein ACOYK7_04380 [Pirellulales bacterium]